MVFGTMIVLAMCGLVFDGGALIAAKRAATNDAEAAARAGAQAIDPASVYTPGGSVRLDPAAAARAAEEFLAANGWTGTATADPTSVTVTITRSRAMTFLHTLGIAERSVTGTATARPYQGVPAP
jgi:Flp pilus assembly protein TadG